jgi:hypothetical protein
LSRPTQREKWLSCLSSQAEHLLLHLSQVSRRSFISLYHWMGLSKFSLLQIFLMSFWGGLWKTTGPYHLLGYKFTLFLCNLRSLITCRKVKIL